MPSKECVFSQRTVHALLNVGHNDFGILERLISLIRLHTLNRMNGLQRARNRPPNNRTLLIYPRRSRSRDKS